MMKSLISLAKFLIIILLFPTILMGSTLFWGTNANYYHSQQQNLHISESTGIGQGELDQITDALLDYMLFKRTNLHISAIIRGQELDVFSEREEQHMVDVRNILRQVFLLFCYLCIALGLALALLIISKQYLTLRQAFKGSLLLSLGVCALTGVLITVDFYYWFTIFHKVLFTNDLWLLDPGTDVLIQMMPLQFFINITVRILLTSFTIIITTFGLTHGLVILGSGGKKG